MWHLLGIAGALAVAALVAARPIYHDDNFFHLRTGELVARTGSVPTVDPFTHTVPGQEWTSHEWGYGLLLHAVHASFGFAGWLVILPVLLLALLALVYGELRRFVLPSRRALCAPLLLLAVWVGDPSCLILRAALITTLGMALLLALLRRMRERGRLRYALGVLAVLLLWANMHAGVTFGLFVIGLHVLQAAWDRRADGVAGLWRGSSLRAAVALLCASAAVTLVNPNGFELWTFPFRVNRIFYGSGLVYAMGQYGVPRPFLYPGFYLLLALVLASCLPLRRLLQVLRSQDAPALAIALGTLFFAVMALRSNRFVLDFAVFAVLFVALVWGGRVHAGVGAAATHTQAERAGSWPRDALSAALVAAVALVVQPALPGRTFDTTIPVALGDFMLRERIAGRMFNAENFGGYLGYRSKQPVYWDGRNDIFLPVALEYAEAPDFGALLDRRGVDMLVLNAGLYERHAEYLAGHRQQWALVFFDDGAALYLKRLPKFQHALRHEYQLLRPFSLPSEEELARAMQNARVRAALRGEVARAVGQSWNNGLARMLAERMAAVR